MPRTFCYNVSGPQYTRFFIECDFVKLYPIVYNVEKTFSSNGLKIYRLKHACIIDFWTKAIYKGDEAKLLTLVNSCEFWLVYWWGQSVKWPWFYCVFCRVWTVASPPLSHLWVVNRVKIGEMTCLYLVTVKHYPN